MASHKSLHELYHDDLAGSLPGLAPAAPEMALSMALHGTLPGFGALLGPQRPQSYLSPYTPIEDQIETLSGARELNSNQMRCALMERSGSHSSRASLKVAKKKVSSPRDFIPAVWPFPTPIPHEPPVAMSAGQQASSASCGLGATSSTFCSTPFKDAQSSAWSQSERGSEAEQTEGSQQEPLLSRWSFALKRKNKARANKWISECKPKTWLLACEKALWIQHRAEREQAERSRNRMLRRMNRRGDMSFESWLKKSEDEVEAEELSAERVPDSTSRPNRSGDQWAPRGTLSSITAAKNFKDAKNVENQKRPAKDEKAAAPAGKRMTQRLRASQVGKQEVYCDGSDGEDDDPAAVVAGVARNVSNAHKWAARKKKAVALEKKAEQAKHLQSLGGLGGISTKMMS